jgi:hypothetical protein
MVKLAGACVFAVCLVSLYRILYTAYLLERKMQRSKHN